MTQPSNSNANVGNRSTKASSYTLRNLIYRKQWDKIETECNCNPSQAKKVDKLGDLPLHEACLQAAPFHVIKNLIIAHPAGVKKKGFCGRLPLHYAAYCKPSLNIIKLLLKNYPEGASTLDSDGRLPVHLAVVRNAPKEAILVLISAFPRSLHTQNKFGSTPQMLARNEHIQTMLQEEEVRPRYTLQTIESEKKLKKVWTAPNAIVSKNGKKAMRPHTTGQILKTRRNSINRTLAESASSHLIDRSNMHPRTKEIFKKRGGKQIPPPSGTIFDNGRMSIPTPPGTPSRLRKTVSSTNVIDEIFSYDKTYSQPYTRNTKVEQAILV
eukprot:CAMPEP_0198266564 /NCGR_PEP_ID=MMETSP1447-20131203/28906_1 /TAXON_ID=420782 /ORGANISM="Chaetoceros dichaeta, Strain CCMP1751" /LENGTH=324 /DNA_ID=CAMNT_0043956707 /DNA_START=9 /DNA_END=983 /DNA_ORIENTATION=-